MMYCETDEILYNISVIIDVATVRRVFNTSSLQLLHMLASCDHLLSACSPLMSPLMMDVTLLFLLLDS